MLSLGPRDGDNCAPALHQIEQAWRANGTANTDMRKMGCSAMLQEICMHRSRLGRVITMYTPGHRGIAPNEYADAVAKAHLSSPLEHDIGRDVAKRMVSWPCIHVHHDDGGICQRRLYREAHTNIQDWVCRQLTRQQRRPHELLPNHTGQTTWHEVATITGQGSITELCQQRAVLSGIDAVWWCSGSAVCQ